MGALFSIFASIPFVGKHKTVLGAVTTAAGGVLQLAGQEALGGQMQHWGTAFMGLGIAHKGYKNRGN